VFFRISLIAAAIALPASVQAAPAQKATGQAAAPQTISKADFLKDVDTRFNAIDANHDGVISKEEIAAAQAKALQQAQAAEDQRIEAEFKKLDTNKDGQLSLAEFKAAAPALRVGESAEQMLASLDANKDGKVTKQEYEARPLANFEKVDTNHDGVLTAQEVAAARRK
jgi:Ca2+-binding EF-hand superfamily protein